MRNADLRAPVGNLPAPDGRPYFGGAGNNSLNPSLAGGGGYVLDKTSDGHSLNGTPPPRKKFASRASTTPRHSLPHARHKLKATPNANGLWQDQPLERGPHKPETRR